MSAALRVGAYQETYIDTTSRNKGDTALRVGRLVLAQELKLVVFVLKVSDVTITIMC